MKKLLFAVLLLASSSAWAEWYTDGSAFLSSDYERPATSLSIGYVSASKWYAEAGISDFAANHFDYRNSTATTAATYTKTKTAIEADTRTQHYHVLLGKQFSLASSVGFYVEGGPYFYDSEITVTSDTTDSVYDSASDDLLSETTVHNYTDKTTDSGTSYLAGIGLSLHSESFRVNFGAAYFDELDDTFIDIGIAYLF